MAQRLSPELQELKRKFIVPVGTIIVPRPAPRRPRAISLYYYCPFAPCCSECVGIFTFREALSHLRRTHEKTTDEIKRLVHAGLPPVPQVPSPRRSQ